MYEEKVAVCQSLGGATQVDFLTNLWKKQKI